MVQVKLKYLLLPFVFIFFNKAIIHAAPVKSDSSEPAPRTVMLLVKFKQEEKGITTTITSIGLADGLIKNRFTSLPGNNVLFYVNTQGKERADSLQIPSPLQEQYEYPAENNTMAYKTVAVKEKTVLLRFAWQPGLKSLHWFWPATGNKLASTPQVLLLPKSITQPD